jgi:hypothetical protein
MYKIILHGETSKLNGRLFQIMGRQMVLLFQIRTEETITY